LRIIVTPEPLGTIDFAIERETIFLRIQKIGIRVSAKVIMARIL